MRVVVGFAPGGTTDVMARVLAQGLTEALGQSVIVDNKPGASGNIAAGEVIKAAPDGYTVLVAPTSVETANPSLFKSSILPSRDLTPVMGIGRTQMYVITRPGLEVKDLKQLDRDGQGQSGQAVLRLRRAPARRRSWRASSSSRAPTPSSPTCPYRGAAPRCRT